MYGLTFLCLVGSRAYTTGDYSKHSICTTRDEALKLASTMNCGATLGVAYCIVPLPMYQEE